MNGGEQTSDDGTTVNMATDSRCGRGFMCVCLCVCVVERQSVICFCHGRSAARRSGVLTWTGEMGGAEEPCMLSKNASEAIFGQNELTSKTYTLHRQFIHLFSILPASE